jgi:hypothetical protein
MKLKYLSIRSILSLLAILFSVQLSAQTEIKGTVTNAETGEPLIGATVLVIGADSVPLKGTMTDNNGSFFLKVGEEGKMLRFSYLGYDDKTVDIGEERVINVVMEAGGLLLDEVVVVGYGSQSKLKLTSAVSTVDEETLKKLPVANVSNGLEGLAAGLFVRQGSGEPGFSSSSFEVRNFGNALVIVDGSPGNIDELDPMKLKVFPF